MLCSHMSLGRRGGWGARFLAFLEHRTVPVQIWFSRSTIDESQMFLSQEGRGGSKLSVPPPLSLRDRASAANNPLTSLTCHSNPLGPSSTVVGPPYEENGEENDGKKRKAKFSAREGIRGAISCE